MEKKTTRVQIELPDSAFSRLKALRTRTGAASYAEVMRNALRLYEALVDEAEAGNDIVIRDKDGQDTTVKFVF